MKLTLVVELLVILIIVAYGAAKPIEEARGIKVSSRQEIVTAAPVEAVPAAPAKPTAVEDDDDDIDLLALLGDDGKVQFEILKNYLYRYYFQTILRTMMAMMIWTS